MLTTSPAGVNVACSPQPGVCVIAVHVSGATTAPSKETDTAVAGTMPAAGYSVQSAVTPYASRTWPYAKVKIVVEVGVKYRMEGAAAVAAPSLQGPTQRPHRRPNSGLSRHPPRSLQRRWPH